MKLKKYQASRASVVLLLLLAGCAAAPYWYRIGPPLPACAPTAYVDHRFMCGSILAEGCAYRFQTCAFSIVMRGPGVECRESHEQAHHDGWWHDNGWKLARTDCGPTEVTR